MIPQSTTALKQLHAAQQTDHAALSKRVAQLDADMARARQDAEDRGYTSAKLNSTLRELREAATGVVAPLSAAMAQRAKEADGLAQTFTPEEELRRAMFSGETELAWDRRLERTPTPELIEYLRFAASEVLLPLVGLVQREFSRRADRTEYLQAWSGAWRKVAFPVTTEARGMLGAVQSLGGLGAERLTYVTRGHGDPAARMTAARRAAA